MPTRAKRKARESRNTFVTLWRRLKVPAELPNWRPVWADRQWGRGKLGEGFARIYDLSAHYRHDRFQALYVFFRIREVVRRENRKIRKLPWSDRSLFVFLGREPTTPYRVQTQRFGALEAIVFRIQRGSPDRSPGYKPVEGEEGVVARHVEWLPSPDPHQS